jgi:hypothetical protein
VPNHRAHPRRARRHTTVCFHERPRRFGERSRAATQPPQQPPKPPPPPPPSRARAPPTPS